MGHFKRSLVAAALLAAGATTFQFEPAILRDVAAGDVRIGAVRVSLWGAAAAQGVEAFTLENVSFKSGFSTFEAKQVVLSGVTSSRADIDILLSSASTQPLADRLARISAARVVIPQLTLKQQVGQETHSTTYKNITLTNIVEGRIGQAIVEATTGDLTDGNEKTSFGTGRSTISELDLPALARLYEMKSGAVPERLSKIHGAFSVENFQMADLKEGAKVAIARISGRDFMARTIRESWTGATVLFTELATKNELTEDEQRRLIGVLADFLGAFDVGFIEATGFTMTASVTEKTKKTGLTINAARLAYTGATESTSSDMRLEGLEILEPNVRVAVASTSLTGFSLAPTLEGLKALEGKSFDDLDTAAFRSLVPTIGTYRQSGAVIDIRESKVKGEERDAVKATAQDFEFTADKPLNGAPTNIRISWQNKVTALPAGSDETWIKEIRALGYKTLDTSFALAAHWNEAANEFVITELSVSAADMMRISASGVIGNVVRDTFSADHGTAAAALLSAKPKSLKVRIDDGTLLDRILDRMAKQEKTTTKDLRDVYAEGATLMSLGVLGGSPAAKVIARIVAAYVREPGPLALEATTKNPDGITFLEMMAVGDPKKILEKIDITAR